MYLDPASSGSLTAIDVTMGNSRLDLEQNLWNRVRAAFPLQTCSTLRLEQSGGDHLLLIVDENRAFRFPRSGKHGLGLEIRVLECLRGQARVAIPAYDLVDPDGGFAGYPLIPGVQLTPTRFSGLSIDAGRAVLADAVAMLKLLHALEPDVFMLVDRWPRMWSTGQFADRIVNERLPLLADRLPALAMPITAFLDRYRADQVPRDVVLHGDLVGDHLLIDETIGRLSGLIDFSDVALGDPAHDLLGFWAYGAPAAAYAAKCCADAEADPTLLARSHRHFVRYEIDRLYDSIVEGASDGTIQQHGTKVIELIAASLRPTQSQESMMAEPTTNENGSPERDPAARYDSAATDVKQDAVATAGQAKRQASSLLDQAKDKVITVASTQKDGVADRIDELAQSVHKAGEPFAGQQEWIADAIERGASELQSLASSLRDNDVGSLARQVGSLAQRKPALFAGICLAGGLALARVGKLVAADLSREDLPSLPEVGHGN